MGFRPGAAHVPTSTTFAATPSLRRAFATRSAEALLIGIDWLSTVTTIQPLLAVVVMNRAIAIALNWVKRYRTNFSGRLQIS